MRTPEPPRIRHVLALVVVFLTFILLAFSGDFVDATLDLTGREAPPPVILVVDSALLLLVGVVTAALHWPYERVSRRRLLICWSNGALLTLAPDVIWALTIAKDRYHVAVDLWLASVYIASLSVLALAVVGAPPVRRRHAGGDWTAFRAVVPLLVGTTAAYLGSTVWGWHLNPLAIRFPDRNGDCTGGVNQEYFAQLSQVIPLLLVALGIEAGLFRSRTRQTVERSVAILTVLILCIAEALAISALPVSNDDCRQLLSPWHEYVAFVTTLEASFVALAVLFSALLADRGQAGGSDTSSEGAARQFKQGSK